MEQIIKTYFENKSEKSQRIGVPRITLYSWLKNPNRANLDLIEKDVRDLLQLIENEMAAPADAVKSDWDLRLFFEQLRYESQSGDISLTPEQQEEICRLVERFYR